MTNLHAKSLAAAVALAATAAAGLSHAGEITIFEDDNFRGNSMRINSEVTSLDGTGMNDRVQSVIVRDGVWEVCRDANFSGGCIQLQPGRYAHMDSNFVRNISSLREVGAPRYVGLQGQGLSGAGLSGAGLSGQASGPVLPGAACSSGRLSAGRAL